MTRPHKYSAIATTVDGIRFASRLEAQLYAHLRVLKDGGVVSYFLRQVPLHLPGGVRYVVDFQVFYPDGSVRYLDAKGYETAVYKTKVRMVEALYPIHIEAVRKYRGRLQGL